MKKNELALKSKESKLLKELQQEINKDVEQGLRKKAKELILNIKRTEIVLSKQKEQLKELLSGKKQYTEEELLFED